MSSTPSTPRRARTASPSEEKSPEVLTPGRKIKSMLAAFDSDPESDNENSKPRNSPEILTPGRKIKSVLAAFDSDSEPDNENSKPRNSPSRPNYGLQIQSDQQTSNEPQGTAAYSDEDEGEDADNVVVPKGRMAAQMQGEMQTDGNGSTGGNNTETAFERVSREIREARNEKEQEKRRRDMEQEERDTSSSDDELPSARPRRRLLKAKEQLEFGGDDSSRSSSPARSDSPLFMPAGGDGGQGDDAQDHDDCETGSDNGKPRSKANSRFLALVAQKRKEREEKEKKEAEKKASKAAKMEKFNSDILSGGESDADDDNDNSGRKFTQQARPSRKASKKALEEMNRETQRMSRNMQLAHQAKTKKKITKESFFARFNFMQPQGSDETERPRETSSTTGSQRSSDGEAGKKTETPQTSPVLAPSDDKTPVWDHTGTQAERVNENTGGELPDLPSFEGLMATSDKQPPEKPSAVAATEIKGKELQTEASKPTNERKLPTRPAVRVLLSRESVAQNQNDDSDSDLEVVTSPGKYRRTAAFENLPAKRNREPSSLLKLKYLAQLSSPTRQSAFMTPAELSATLLYQAKQQAAKERQEKIQELKDKGIIVETAEERAAMEDDVENLMEKARKEANDIARIEKKESDKAGEEEEDEDADYEISGSDEDGNEEDEDEDEEEENDEENDDVHQEGKATVNEENEGLVDTEAGENENFGNDQSEAELSEEEVDMPVSRRKRPTRVISDDEEDDTQEPQTPARPANPIIHSAEIPQIPPGLGATDDSTLSLTQAFAGTLAENQSSNRRDSTEIIPSLPGPARGTIDVQEPDSEVLLRDSQEQPAGTPDILTHKSQYDTQISESPVLQDSQVPDPTQDAGFVLTQFDPSKRFMNSPASTVPTQILQQNTESPITKRTEKRLRRGRQTQLSGIEEENDNGFEIEDSAVDFLKKAMKKKPAVEFDKKKSQAKEIVEEAAEESEDEYAGLGGASDDSEEEDKYDEEMINDNSGEIVDEKQLAALNAGHQRAADEKQVEKLLKDITTGALRRRRAGNDDFDLDDSDDERISRRREKQREFARMRKALLADEKVGQLAENPKKAAFFRAIEDRDIDYDVDLGFLHEDNGDGSQQDSSLSQNNKKGSLQEQGPAVDESNNKKRKRSLEPSAMDVANRPPPHLRRTRPSVISKKPTSLAEIRETVSFLTERPEYDLFHEAASIDIDEEPQANDTDDTNASQGDGNYDHQSATTKSKNEIAVPSHSLRRNRGPVIDRLALLREASSNSASSASASASANSRPAFYSATDIDVTANIGFRPPSLLRRAPAAAFSSLSSTTSYKTPKAVAGGPTTAKKGSVNYYTAAREREREREIRVKERTGPSNIAALLSKRSDGLGALGGKGQWD